jgi:hypothetical protein
MEAEKDFNVKQRLWTEENSILQSRNRSLAEERDRKDKEASHTRNQLYASALLKTVVVPMPGTLPLYRASHCLMSMPDLYFWSHGCGVVFLSNFRLCYTCRHLAQQAAQQSESQLNQLTLEYRELKSAHEGLPERYEAAKRVAKEATDAAATKDSTIQSLQAQLDAKQAELDALSGSAEGRVAEMQKILREEQQRHEHKMSDAHRRWQEQLARLQGEKVMAEACTGQVKSELQDLQTRFELMEEEVQIRDERSAAQIQRLEAGKLLMFFEHEFVCCI